MRAEDIRPSDLIRWSDSVNVLITGEMMPFKSTSETIMVYGTAKFPGLSLFDNGMFVMTEMTVSLLNDNNSLELISRRE